MALTPNCCIRAVGVPVNSADVEDVYAFRMQQREFEDTWHTENRWIAPSFANMLLSASHKLSVQMDKHGKRMHEIRSSLQRMRKTQLRVSPSNPKTRQLHIKQAAKAYAYNVHYGLQKSLKALHSMFGEVGMSTWLGNALRCFVFGNRNCRRYAMRACTVVKITSSRLFHCAGVTCHTKSERTSLVRGMITLGLATQCTKMCLMCSGVIP